MANKYGEIAVATALVCQRNRSDIRDEWGKQAMYAFEGQPASQKKGCPKSAFLALCEAGFINGISKGNYGAAKESKNGYLLFDTGHIYCSERNQHAILIVLEKYRHRICYIHLKDCCETILAEVQAHHSSAVYVRGCLLFQAMV